ncbi:hypothetical protein LTR51_008833, partial [Lithohypha guttulata]
MYLPVDNVALTKARYYFMNREAGSQASTTFRQGFRMISGNSLRRSISIPIPDPPTSEWGPEDMSEEALRQKAIGFNCLGSDPIEGSLQRHFLPNKTFIDDNCHGGLRLELMFPSCWDGVSLDSHDHRSHVAFPSLLHDGECPKGFTKRIPTLLYELAWQTQAFRHTSGTFVLANGDTSGLSYHGDFMTGWAPEKLRQAGDICTDMSGDIN